MNRYELQSGVLRIRDEELGIDLDECYDISSFCMKKEQKEGDIYHLYCLLNGKLHGPSLYYDIKGTIFSSSWFYQGARLGKVRQYYPTGILYASLGYKEGKREGEHRYYYPDGTLRTLMHYTKGCLDKELILFWPNGQKKRHLYVCEGKKQGNENFWDESGKLVKEISHAS
jgi:antitoxin component YwqK of YwqJK toxin-antitoxin module